MAAKVFPFARPASVRARLGAEVVQRLAHSVAMTPRGSTLNRESLHVAWLYQHAHTELRQKLHDVIRQNPCQCVGCASKGGAV